MSLLRHRVARNDILETRNRCLSRFSKGQKEHHQHFEEASIYVRYAVKTQPSCAEIAKETMKTAYNFALSDWFNPLVIHQVQQRDGRIFVEASENVIVVKVVITVLDEEGKVVEQSEVLRREGNWWEYVPEMEGKMILAEAWGLAGNMTTYKFAKPYDL